VAVSPSRSITPWKSASARSAARPAPPRRRRPADLGQGAVEVGPLAVELVDDDHPRQAQRAAARQASSVWACTPSVALTTTTARSTLARAVSISPAKSAYPGRVEQVHLDPVDRERGQAVEMDSWREISSGSKSHVVVPFSTEPRRAMAPVAARSASASVVFPAP
jgi:hypothetical protein